MFGIHIITDVIKIPASDLQYQNTVVTTTTVAANATTAHDTKNPNVNGDVSTGRRIKVVQKKKSLLPIIHREIDLLYPNRVLIDIGLVICRYYHPSHSTMNPMDCLGDETVTTPSKKRKRSQSSLLPNGTKRKSKKELLFTGTTKLLQNGGTCDNYGSSMNVGCGVHYNVQFPVIVFRPYVGEVLYGTICDMNQNGIIVTLGNFFAAIYIPTIYMLQPSTYVHTDSSNNGIWVWAPTYDDDDEDDDENNEPLRYEMNIGDEIRVRVKSIHYSKPSSTASSCKNGKPSSVDPVSRHKTDNATTTTLPLPTLPHCAMYIIASICEDGLGLTSWWKNELDDDDAEEEEEDTAENGNAVSS